MASTKVRGITIELGGDTSGLSKALKDVNTEIGKTQKDLKDVERLLKLDPGNTELLAQKQRLLNDRIGETKTKLDALKTAQSQVDMSTEEGQRQYDALTREIASCEAELKDLEAQASKSKEALKKISEAGEKLKDIGGKVKDVGKNLTTHVTVPITAAGAGAIKAASDFETAFTGVRKTVDATEEEYQQLSDWIKEASTRMASSKEDIAGVMEVAGQLGVTGVDNLEAFTETMVMLGDTTNLSAADAATSLARFMNITGESYQNSDKLGSAIVDLGNNFATSESEIVAMATRLASAGTISGLTSTEILALAASMSSVGIEAEAGGTAMTQTFTAIEKAVANGGDKLDEFAKISGMDSATFAKTWKDEPIVAIQSFVKGLGDLDEQGESATLVLDDLGLSGVRQSNMLKSLSLAADTMTDAIETSSKAYEENNALTDEANKRYSTSESQMLQFGEKVKNVGIQFGETLLPKLSEFLDKLSEMLDKFEDLTPEQQEAIVNFALFAAAIGPVLSVIGSLMTGLGGILTALPQIGTAIGTVSTFITGTAIPALGSLVAAIAPVIAAAAPFIAAAGLVIAAGVLVCKNWEEIKEAAKLLVERTKEHWEEFKKKFEELGKKIGEKVNDIKQKFNDMKQGIADKINDVKSKLEEFKQGWEEKINAIKSKVEDFKQTVSDKFNSIKDSVVKCFDGIKNGIKSPINAALGFVEKFINNMIDGFNKLGDKIGSLEFDVPDWVPGDLGGKHFKLGLPELNHVSLPRLASGGIMTSGSAIVGEAGPELLSVRNGQSIVQPLGGQQGALELQGLLETYLPYLAMRQNILLDGDKLVGQTAGRMNEALGTISLRSART